MTELVPPTEIEALVGAKRHPVLHLGRADSATETVYILHSELCRSTGIDLRACVFSQALDRGIDERHWVDQQDRAVVLTLLVGPALRPALSTDAERAGIELLEREP